MGVLIFLQDLFLNVKSVLSKIPPQEHNKIIIITRIIIQIMRILLIRTTIRKKKEPKQIKYIGIAVKVRPQLQHTGQVKNIKLVSKNMGKGTKVNWQRPQRKKDIYLVRKGS